jgi:FkbM family methyltransferase
MKTGSEVSAEIGNPKTVNTLRGERLAGLITREEYWDELRNRLRVLTDIVHIAQRENLALEISAAGAQILIPLENNESIIRMMFDVEDIRSVPFTVIAEGPYEQFQAQILFALGKSANGFLDIGANMGFYSLALATLNPALNVQSFEPQPQIYSCFSTNVSLNKLESQVKIYNYGLGSKEENLNMYIPSFTGSGGGSFANLHKEEGDPEEFLVPVRPLDTLVHPNSNFDLIKVDVEGFEFEVLKGGLKLIESDKPTIVIELLRKWMKPFGKQPQDVINLLEPLGYEVLSIGLTHLTSIKVIDESTPETNFIFVHKNNNQHLNLLRKNFTIE